MKKLLRKLWSVARRIQQALLRPWRTRRSLHDRSRFFRALAGPGDLVFDVGANRGDWVEAFLRNGNRVVAVEPQAECVKLLQRRFGDRIAIEAVGLGDKIEMRTLHIASEDTISSFSQSWIEAVQATRFHDYRWNQTQQVPMTTLDALIEKHGRPVFLKIDVEGFELEVLTGLTRPVPVLSFEYTVPERVDQVTACVERLAALEPGYRFNYGAGLRKGPMALELSHDLSSLDFLTLIQTSAFQQTLVGDVYARL